MSLLKRVIVYIHFSTPPFFTFHYVAIKTTLLPDFVFDVYGFTFHYVAIKTHDKLIEIMEQFNFTFHYVAIKTRVTNYKHPFDDYLYIPLCRY